MIEMLVGSGAVLLFLGALHGLNPGMGWLFAVALGIQEEDGRAVWGSLVPLAVGHGLAITAAIGLASIVGLVLSPETLRWAVAAALFGMGIFHLRRHRHPRWGGMRVGAKDLVVWSFLMASVHGAGLMALPFLPEPGTSVVGAHASAAHAAATHHQASASRTAVGGDIATGSHAGHLPGPARADYRTALLATLIHTVGYLLMTGIIAAVVFHWVGIGLLRRAWLNLDLLWAGALIVTALLIPLI